MNRRGRERLILRIVAEEPVATQGELVAALGLRGVHVTQATVSRDIRRLGLVKAASEGGFYRYAASGEPVSAPAARHAVQVALREFALGLDHGEGIVSIRTQSGCANAVAVAIDEAEVPGVVATLAGDDTILIVTRSLADRDALLADLRSLV